MTFNSSQQERLLAALERIADTTVRIADALEAQANPPRVFNIQAKSPLTEADMHRIRDEIRATNSTKGPYR